MFSLFGWSDVAAQGGGGMSLPGGVQGASGSASG